jgi:ribonuclease BN (tRNA processing enzyme)
MSLKLRLHGVRGSRPTHKRNLLGYGGNSTSFEISNDFGFYLFIDGGTGLVPRGKSISTKGNNRFHFLITHTHWDHILGLPFFEPFYDASNHITFYASKTSRSNFNELFLGLHRSANLPIPISQLRAKVDYVTIAPDSTFQIENKITVKTFQLNHQGVTLGYRIEDGDQSVCIITDNAPIDNGNYLGEEMQDRAKQNPTEFEKSFNEGLVNFLSNANTVVFDTHFIEKTLKIDWGHSTPHRALNFCKQAKVSRLVLFHHAPEDNDDDVDAKVQSILSEAIANDIEVVAAKEGDSWDLLSA